MTDNSISGNSNIFNNENNDNRNGNNINFYNYNNNNGIFERYSNNSNSTAQHTTNKDNTSPTLASRQLPQPQPPLAYMSSINQPPHPNSSYIINPHKKLPPQPSQFSQLERKQLPTPFQSALTSAPAPLDKTYNSGTNQTTSNFTQIFQSPNTPQQQQQIPAQPIQRRTVKSSGFTSSTGSNSHINQDLNIIEIIDDSQFLNNNSNNFIDNSSNSNNNNSHNLVKQTQTLKQQQPHPPAISIKKLPQPSQTQIPSPQSQSSNLSKLPPQQKDYHYQQDQTNLYHNILPPIQKGSNNQINQINNQSHQINQQQQQQFQQQLHQQQFKQQQKQVPVIPPQSKHNSIDQRLKIQQYGLENIQKLRTDQIQRLNQLEAHINSFPVSFNINFQNILISTCLDYIKCFNNADKVIEYLQNIENFNLYYSVIGCESFSSQSTIKEACNFFRNELEINKRADLLVEVNRAYNQISNPEKRKSFQFDNNRVVCPACKGDCFINPQLSEKFFEGCCAQCYHCEKTFLFSTCTYCSANYTLPAQTDKKYTGTCFCVLCRETLFIESLYPSEKKSNFSKLLKEYHQLKRLRDEEIYKNIILLGHYSSTFPYEYERTLDLFDKNSVEYKHFRGSLTFSAPPPNYIIKSNQISQIESAMREILRLDYKNVSRFVKRPYDHYQQSIEENLLLLKSIIYTQYIKEFHQINQSFTSISNEFTSLTKIYYDTKKDFDKGENNITSEQFENRKKELLLFIQNYKNVVNHYHYSFDESKFISTLNTSNITQHQNHNSPSYISDEIFNYFNKIKDENIYLLNRFKYLKESIFEKLQYLPADQRHTSSFSKLEEGINSTIKDLSMKIELFKKNFESFGRTTVNQSINSENNNSTKTTSDTSSFVPPISHINKSIRKSGGYSLQNQNQNQNQQPQLQQPQPQLTQQKHLSQQKQQQKGSIDTLEEVEKRIRLIVHEAWDEFNEIAERRVKTNYDGPLLLLTIFSESEIQNNALTQIEEKRRLRKEKRRLKEEKRKQREERREKHRKKRIKPSNANDSKNQVDEEDKPKDIDSTISSSLMTKEKVRVKKNEILESSPPPIDKDLEPITQKKSLKTSNSPTLGSSKDKIKLIQTNNKKASNTKTSTTTNISLNQSPNTKNNRKSLISLPNDSIQADPNNDIYTVEKILGKRQRGSTVEYLIKWEGYDIKEATWEEKGDCYCIEMIEEYERNPNNNMK